MMTALAQPLPNRRVEAWKYSDLRAALRDTTLAGVTGRGHVIAELAGGETQLSLSAGESAVEIERLAADGLEARASNFNLAPGAALTRIVLQTGGGVPLSLCRVRLGEGAVYRQFVFAEGAKLARIETEIEAGLGAEVALNGVYVCGPGRHADLTSRIVHAQPAGKTRQLVKGAARAGGRGVFQGKIVVAEGAQKTDAQQHHHALLLEDGAEINAKPELEIYADDVACAHGNTAGALDEAALFYMRARGLSLPAARALLIEAFLAEAVPAWAPEIVREEVLSRIAGWLEAST